MLYSDNDKNTVQTHFGYEDICRYELQEKIYEAIEQLLIKNGASITATDDSAVNRVDSVLDEDLYEDMDMGGYYETIDQTDELDGYLSLFEGELLNTLSYNINVVKKRAQEPDISAKGLHLEVIRKNIQHVKTWNDDLSNYFESIITKLGLNK